MVDDVAERREPTVVIEAALRVRPQAARAAPCGSARRASGSPGSRRCRSRRPVCMFQPGSVNSRRHVAARALRLAVEQRLRRAAAAAASKLPAGGVGARDRELVEVQRRRACGVIRSSVVRRRGRSRSRPRPGTCVASSRRGSKKVPLPCISRFATNAFQYVHRAPARPRVQVDARRGRTPAGSASRPVLPSGRNALPSRNSSASNLPGAPAVRAPSRTVALVDAEQRRDGAERSGASATIAPTFRSRFAQPSQPMADAGRERIVDRRVAERALDADRRQLAARASKNAGDADDRVRA